MKRPLAFLSSLPSKRTFSEDQEERYFSPFHSRPSYFSRGLLPTPYAAGGTTSFTQLHASPLFLGPLTNRLRNGLAAVVPSLGTTTLLCLAALWIGYKIGRHRPMKTNKVQSSGLLHSNSTILPEEEISLDFVGDVSSQLTKGGTSTTSFASDAGVTPVWLNYAIAKLWKLFQKNTRQFTQEQLQPILDDVKKPDFVKDVRIVSYNIANHSAPKIYNLRPVPARSLAEIQCVYDLEFQSQSEIGLEVDVVLGRDKNNNNSSSNDDDDDDGGGDPFTVPVSISNLHVSATMWSAFTLAPYEPYCTSFRYSTLSMPPKVDFDLKVAQALPITNVPGLRNLFFQIIRQEIPKDFTFPKHNLVDFTPKTHKNKKQEFMNWTLEELDQRSESEIREIFPKEWAFYQSLDLDQNGCIGPEELGAGLEDWGYAVEDAQQAYYERLQPNAPSSDRKGINFTQFCLLWPNVTASEIPRDYEGILSVGLSDRAITNLTPSQFSLSNDLKVQLTLGKDTVQARVSTNDKDEEDVSDHSTRMRDPFELKCRSTQDDVLSIQVLEDTALPFQNPTLATATLPLHNLLAQNGSSSAAKRVEIDLEPHGRLALQLSYGKFVDEWDICRTEQPQDDTIKDYDGNTKNHTSEEPGISANSKEGEEAEQLHRTQLNGTRESVVQKGVKRVAAQVYEKAKRIINV